MLSTSICAEPDVFTAGTNVKADGTGIRVLEEAQHQSSQFATPEDEFEAKQRILEMDAQNSDDIEHNDDLFVIPAAIASAYVPSMGGWCKERYSSTFQQTTSLCISFYICNITFEFTCVF